MELLQAARRRGVSVRHLYLPLLLLLIGIFRVAPADALPAACSLPGNFCTVPATTPWTFFAQPGFNIFFANPNFSSEQAAVAALAARMVQGTGWCTVTPSTGVTHDDNPNWGSSPQYFGNIDIQHGNTAHFDVTGHVSDGCSQNWEYHPGILQWRQVKCLPGTSVVFDSGINSAPFCLGSRTQLQPTKAQGTCPTADDRLSRIWKGNPCDVTNGNKYQAESDYRGAGANSLAFVRSYNSLAATVHFTTGLDPLEPLGIGWTATYFQRLAVGSVSVGSSSYETLYAFRPDGRVLTFNRSGTSSWVRVDDDTADVVTSTVTGYEYRTAADTVEIYDSTGRLTELRKRGAPTQTLSYAGEQLLPSSVEDAFGNTLTFSYTSIASRNRLTTFTDPAGHQTVLSYGQEGQLTSVEYPDGKTRIYGYGPYYRLASLTDEQSNVYSTWTYDSSTGDVQSSEHANGVEHYTFASSGTTRWVTDPLGIHQSERPSHAGDRCLGLDQLEL